MSAYRKRAASWDARRARVREWAARRTPKVLTNYPFEILAGVIALLMGLPFLLGTVAPASLIGLVGPIGFYAWAAGLTIGGATTLVGLRVGDRPNPMIVAAGLQLAGGAFAVYAIAVVVVLGLVGWTAVSAYVLLALLSMVRASHFRRIVDIQKGARRLHDNQEPK